ncbi:MAG: T9SS type A sorting domain-containing protein [Candidatus Cloacimonadales bacterium]
MKKVIILLLLIHSLALFSWNSFGPPDLNVNNYLCANTDILCTESGLLLYDWEADEWIEYSYGGLPIWQAIRHGIDEILVVMGAGSYSDGLYSFNLNSEEFTVIEWMINPNFIYQTVAGYYVGYESGLLFSNDLQNWVAVDELAGYDCVDMESSAAGLVVSTGDLVFHSTDGAATWSAAENSPLITDMTFDQAGKLWGIFPSVSNSSGLYSSSDLGETWDVEMWSLGMSSVYWVGGEIYLAWEADFGEGSGVARWNETTNAPEFMNDGLPDTEINKLTTNDMVDCYNLVACTEAGAYIEFELQVSAEEQEIAPLTTFSNYPNPFAKQTTFSLHHPRQQIENYTYQIYNIKGELVETLENKQAVWQSENRASGIYLVKLFANQQEIAHKKISLIK